MVASFADTYDQYSQEPYDDLWYGDGTRAKPRRPNVPAVAAGSQAQGPAKAQDLMGTGDTSFYDTTFSSDFDPYVSSYVPANDPTPPQALAAATNNGPSTSQIPTVQTQSSSTPIKSGTASSNLGNSAGTSPLETSTPATPATPSTPSTPTTTTSSAYVPQDSDWETLLKDVPGVLEEFNQENSRDAKSINNLNSLGIHSPTDYAKWWYNNLSNGSYTLAGSKAPAPGSGTVTPPPTGVDATTPGGATGTPGAGQTTGSTSANRLAALNQALSRAKIAVAGRGLNWDNYKNLFDPIYQDIYNSIPDTDTNPNSWFDPNMANTILGGEENRQRNQYRQQVNGLTRRADPHVLDATIMKILGESGTQAEQMLQAGLKRGQFNDVGYQAGQSALTKAKSSAQSKLYGYAGDLVSKYDGSLQGIYEQALGAASGYQLGDNFDLSPYQKQDNDILSQIGMLSEGDLYNLLGDNPLIDLNDIRMGAGTGQGAVNLNDLDVLDALAKRKTANEVGRGLGSQGAF